PVLVVTMVDNQHKARALGADDFAVKPVDRGWLLDRLNALARPAGRDVLLLVDDDEASRYLLRGLLADTRFEAGGAGSGPGRARGGAAAGAGAAPAGRLPGPRPAGRGRRGGAAAAARGGGDARPAGGGAQLAGAG